MKHLSNIRHSLLTLKALLLKEVMLMRHNPLVPKVVFMMPLAVMLIMPLVASFDVKRVGIAVVDTDNSALSRRIVADMSASEWLIVDTVSPSFDVAMQALERGTTDVILALPDGLERQPSKIDISANGVNALKGGLGAQYAAQSATLTMKQWQAEHGGQISNSPKPEDISVINLYNPTQNYRHYMIPALMGVLIIVICGFLPSLNLVSEKETGTIEAMNVTPVGKLTFVLSKLIPFWIIGLVVSIIGLTTGWLVYDLDPAGSIGALLLSTILFSFVMSGFGVTVANQSATMMQSILVMYAFIMVFQLMGGLFTPISSMPQWAQCITYCVPTRYYINIMRSVCLKGSSVADLSFDYICLSALALGMCLLAALTYRKQN